MAFHATLLTAGSRAVGAWLHAGVAQQIEPRLWGSTLINSGFKDTTADNYTLFSPRQQFATQKRFAKSIHRKGKTAPYQRRLFESVLAPIMPEDVPEQRDWWRCRGGDKPIDYTFSELRLNELDGLQRVVLRIVKEEIASNSVLMLCQRLPCITNDFKIMAADVYDFGLRYNSLYSDRVMRNALQDTPLETLVPLIYNKTATFICAEFDPVRLARAFRRLHYALPLAIVVDRQVILSKSQVEQLAKTAPSGVLDMQTQLSALLQKPVSALASCFSHELMQLNHNLGHLKHAPSVGASVPPQSGTGAAAVSSTATLDRVQPP